MKKFNISGKDLRRIGFIDNKLISITKNIVKKHYKHSSKAEILQILSELLEEPSKFKSHKHFSAIVELLDTSTGNTPIKETALLVQKDYMAYGIENIEPGAISQMEMAMKLPITLKGALMPDAHQGYGLPIGGVVAVKDAVIPYGVGMDIGCRMCLSVFGLKEQILKSDIDRLKNMIVENTRFGRAEFKNRLEHEVTDRKEFSEIKFLRSLHKKAWEQLGTSGHGNHFVDFGVIEVKQPQPGWNVMPGRYFAILSHSGSRNMGAEIARHYTRVAQEKLLLPKGAKNLAWLELKSQEGQEYWAAMTLAGDYATANHHLIHYRLAKALGEKPLFKIENHHNYAWKEKLDDKTEAIIHRKGATPAYKDALGIIPGSMALPAYIVKGKGNKESLESAAHGAGRVMSRNQAKESITNKQLRSVLEKHGITLIGGGLDEAPQAYKDIHQVMKSQEELVETIALFYPKLVRMG